MYVFLRTRPDSVFDHQTNKLATVNEYDGFTFHSLDVSLCLRREAGRGKENTLAPLRAFLPTSAPTKSLTSPAGTLLTVYRLA